MIEITLNGEKRQIADSTSLVTLLNNLDLASRRVAVVRNGDVVHHEDYASTVLGSGETVDIIQMVGGG